LKRISIIAVTMLAFFVAACSGGQASPSTETTEPTPQATQEPTPEPTEEPTQEPSEEPASTDEATGGDQTALEDLLPDEVNGMARVDVPGLEQFLGPMLEAQGEDASNVDFAFATYGEGDDAVAVNAFRVPDMSRPQLQQLAEAMAQVDTQSDVTTEATTVGGKDVLKMTGAEVDGVVYVYFYEGAVFTVTSMSEDLATQLLAELP
jgi:hypothetical protein